MLVANHRPTCNTKSSAVDIPAVHRSLSAEEYERVSPSEIAGDVLMRAMRDDRLDRPCLIVLAEIATSLDPATRTFWFGRERIADKTGLALQTVSNCLSRLKAAGHIDSCRRVTPRSNGDTLMHYELGGLAADDDVAPRPEAVPRPALSSSVRLAVWDKTSGRCVYCACHLTRDAGQPNTFHADHVLSVRNGGSDDIANLIPSCATCNSRKSAKPFLTFIEEMGGACE